MTRVAIIAALSDELRPLVRGWPSESRSGVDVWSRRHAGGEWVAACAGIGAEAAARAFAEIERDGALDLVVSAGWAGALREGFEPGRAYRVSEVVDASSGERFGAATPSGSCMLVTNRRVADQVEKRRLAVAYGAGLVDMEAAGVARLAAARGIPFICIKGVSDVPSDRMPDLNGFISPSGRFLRGRFMLFAMFRPWYWPTLVRMGRNGRRASQGIGESLREILGEREATATHAGPKGSAPSGE